MPYITQRARRYFDIFRSQKRHAEESYQDLPYIEAPGELTYLMTKLCLDYGVCEPSDGYQRHCEVIGSLVCTALEYYRRAVAPYEDKKIEENGDVYPG